MDIYCVVCGEPWDAYGVNNGDMLHWEVKLFKLGAGCPCCEGNPPDGKQFEPTNFEHVENGDEDPMERIFAYQDFKEGKAPKWERPEPKVFWTCDGCGVQVRSDPDLNELEYHSPDAKINHLYSHGNPQKKPAHKFGESSVCEFCLENCNVCGKDVSSHLDHGDVYDPGWCGYDEYNDDVICVECLESQCSDCHRQHEDCECEK